MWDWLRDNAWAAWLGGALLLATVGVVTLDLVALMLAVGALVAMAVALVGLPGWTQVLAAVLASVAMLALVRPGMARRLQSGPDLVLGHAKLVGRTGTVVTEISDHTGEIRVAGEVWTARPYDETAAAIPVGAKVDIFEVKGATLLVHAIPELE